MNMCDIATAPELLVMSVLCLIAFLSTLSLIDMSRQRVLGRCATRQLSDLGIGMRTERTEGEDVSEDQSTDQARYDVRSTCPKMSSIVGI